MSSSEHQENSSDKQIKNFFNHLFNIGLLNSHSIKDIVGIYNKHKLLNPNSSLLQSPTSTVKSPRSLRSYELDNTIKDIMQIILSEFLNKQDSSSIQTIAFDMVSKYTECSLVERTKAANKHFIYYLRFFNKKLKYYFGKWKVNIWKKWKITPKYENYLTTEAKKEQDSLMSCTFKPNINKTSRSMSKQKLNASYSHMDTFTRLYTEHTKLKNKKDLKKDEFNRKEDNQLKQVPSVLNTNVSLSIQQNINILSKSFIERQDDYESLKNKNKQKIQKTNDDVENELFTFTPMVNKSCIEYAYPAYERLYCDSKRRIDCNNQRQLQYEEEILNKSKAEKGRKVNLEKLEGLYYDYKRKQIKQRELIKSVEKDEGITFKPKITENKAFSGSNLLNLDFYGRNEYHLEKQKENIYLQRKLNENMFNQNTYNKEEKDIILRDIEERLYRPAVKRQLNRQNLTENQFSKTKKLSCLTTEKDKDFNANILNSNQKSSQSIKYTFINDLNSD